MKNLFPFLIAFFISACSTLPTLSPVDDVDAVWQQHQRQLSKLHSWKMTGRIAVSNESDSWHATLQWTEQPDQYMINIIAPMGQGGAQIRGDSKGVVLHSDDGKIYQASTAEELLVRHTGWRVPIEGMRFWARGLPKPDGTNIQKLNASGQLAELSQSGWMIKFKRYQQVSNLILPGKVFMDSGALKVKIVIDSWEIN